MSLAIGVLALLSVSVKAGIFNNRQQSLCVSGQVKCGTEPEFRQGHVVKLWDEDQGPNPDDEMAEGLTDSQGKFKLCGSASDVYGTINPVFKIYTQCNNAEETDPRCFRKYSINIPQSHVGSNYTFEEPIDISSNSAGTVTRRCFTGTRFGDALFKYTGSTHKEWFDKLTGDNASGFIKVLATAVALFDEGANATTAKPAQ